MVEGMSSSRDSERLPATYLQLTNTLLASNRNNLPNILSIQTMVQTTLASTTIFILSSTEYNKDLMKTTIGDTIVC
jgi:hypothetical protein